MYTQGIAKWSFSTPFSLLRVFLLMGALIASLPLPALYSDWDPEYCLSPEEDVSRLAPLNEPDFKNLKSTVLRYLQNSWCSSEKAELLMDLILLIKPNVCVEVGVGAGSSLLPVATSLKYLSSKRPHSTKKPTGTIYAIDAWSNKIACRNLQKDDPNRSWWATVDMKQLFELFKKTLATWGVQPYCKVIVKPSLKAAKSLPPIDFLHLDGDYSQSGSLGDVETYLPKVTPGGYILLSNILFTVNGEQPKMSAFCKLCEECEIVAEIENENAVLFQKR